MAERKLMVIGLDGAPYDLLASLAGDGTLPNFRRLFEGGVHGPLRSTIPPLSPLAWSSIMTGLNPGKHGVFAFLDRSGRPYSSRDIMGRTIWDFCSASRRYVICLNIPFVTNPPYPVRGVMVPGFLGPAKNMRTHPPEMARELRDAVGYETEIYTGIDYMGLEESEFVREAVRITRARAEAIFYLTDKFRWDLACAVFTTLDRVQHVFFGRAIRGSPLYDRRAHDVLVGYYKLLDRLVGRIIAEFSSEATLIFLSDHGFEPCYKYVGLWEIVKHFSAGGQPLRLSQRRGSVLARLLSRRDIFTVARAVGTLLIDRTGLVGKLGVKSLVNKAVMQAGLMSGIRKSMDGIECGAETVGFIYVRESPSNALLDELTKYLYAVTDGETGRPVIGRVYRREEIYHGPFLKRAPDIVVIPETGYKIKLSTPGGIEKVRPVKGVTCRTGTHASLEALKGFFAIMGDGIKEGSELDISAYDIAPTALHILGLPVPDEVDGRVLTEAFEEGSELARRPVLRRRMGLRGRIAVRARRLRATMMRRGRRERGGRM